MKMENLFCVPSPSCLNDKAGAVPVFNSAFGLSSLSPSSITNNTTVTITLTGAGLTNYGGGDLIFNGFSFWGETFVSATQITFQVVNLDAGSYPVYYVSGTGTTNTLILTVT
jgi:hypothetical protein